MNLCKIAWIKYLIPIIIIGTLMPTATGQYDHYILNCGTGLTVATTSSFDGRAWYRDSDPTFSAQFNSTLSASTQTNLQPPLSTARVFTSEFTYSFPVSPGPKFIRLFFNPSLSPYVSPAAAGFTLKASDAYLTVEANSGHLLLRNFSAYLSLDPSKESFVQKEFYVYVANSVLNLTLSPSHPGSYAFLNSIEVVSVPERLYVGSASSQITVVGSLTNFDLVAATALETIYRVNVGGGDIAPPNDNGNMYRRWVVEDLDFFINGWRGRTGTTVPSTKIDYASGISNYSGPALLYQTFRSMGGISSDEKKTVNLTWGFEVDFGFNYLVRLHWCEVVTQVNSVGYRVFDVYIAEQMAEEAVDIFAWVGGRDKAVYRDYVVYMDGQGKRGLLKLDLHPNTKRSVDATALDVLLNGLEIFKINRTDGSLDAPNLSGKTKAPVDQTPFPRQNRHSHFFPVIIAAVSGAILVGALLCFLLIYRRKKWSKTSAASSGAGSTKSKGLFFSFGAMSSGTTKRSGGGGSLPSHLCRHFSLAELRHATSDFTPSLIIGHGGFGNVYKGTVTTDAGPTLVAIKRLNPLSGQGAREFTTEIELLSKLRHLHLVSLIGYCDDSGEMILVYEFMSNGTLRDHLYPHPAQHLPWPQRLQICVGAARGLHYLHTGTHRMIIHRDVKSTNILVDDKWVAKVSDFGLSKLGGTVGGDLTHVSTAVKGSFGYVDPEYYRRQQLTEKSDVYSFGVVLFEVLCGRAAVNPALPKEQVNLRIWARRNLASGTLDTIVDPNLKGQIVPECLRKFGEVAESCVRDDGSNRPSMVDVIWGLEFALQLQTEAAAKSADLDYVDKDVFGTDSVASPATDITSRLVINSDENTWTSVNNSSSGLFSSSTSADHQGGSTDVFSQIFKPEGR